MLVLSIGLTKVMTTPRYVASVAGPDGWLAILLGSMGALVAAWVMANLARLFPGETIFHYAPRLVGRWGGAAVGVFYALFWIAIASRETRFLSDLVATYMLERTPVEVIAFAMLLASAYLARNGIEPIARVSQILMPVILIPLSLLLVAAWNQADFSNLKPFMEKGPLPVLKAAGIAFGLFNGLEAMLILFPALAYKARFPRGTFVAVLITLVIQSLAFVSVAVTVGATQAGRFLVPTLTVIQGLRLSSLFFERVTNIALSLWLAAAYAALSVLFYLIALALARLFYLKETRYFVLPLTVVVFLVAMIPPNVAGLHLATEGIWFASGLALFALPLALYVIARVRGFRRPQQGEDSDGENNLGR